MSDELTARIAEVLELHIEDGCTHSGCDPVMGNAFATHLAEQVRAVLGETTTEWGRRIVNGSLGFGHMVGHVSSLWRSEEEARESLEADQDIVVREVTPWTEVPS